MKSVLISIQPKWVEKIASGKKTIEVRKTRPKIETPFKCYIYCTNSNGTLFMAYDGLHYGKDYVGRFDPACVNGKVIGEFICEKIDNYECELWNDEAYELIRQFNYDEYGETEYEHGAENNENCEMLNKACLTWQDIRKYLGQGLNNCYAWHISDLKIYDKLKELGEFRTPCKMGDYPCCGICDYAVHGMDGDLIDCDTSLTRPPQSWQFVESLGE